MIRPRSRSPRVSLDIRGLIGADDILRLSAGAKRDPGVANWLTGEPVDLRAIARQWFEHMRGCGDDVLELMHDGCPVACVDDAPFAYVNSFKSHVNVGFFHGTSLADPAGLLEGRGKRMRHVKVHAGRPIKAAALIALIDAAYADILTRLGHAHSPG